VRAGRSTCRTDPGTRSRDAPLLTGQGRTTPDRRGPAVELGHSGIRAHRELLTDLGGFEVAAITDPRERLGRGSWSVHGPSHHRRGRIVRAGQGVVSFPNPALATAFRDAQVAAWAHCQGGTVSLAMPGQVPQTWSVYDVQDRDGMLSAVDTQDGGQGWQCQRALTVRNNVVVDVRSCGFTDTESAQAIAATIRDRVGPS
jgi:hypothetical protein